MGTSLQSAVALLCLLSLPGAEVGSIGTVNVHGEIRVDKYAVRGNTTLFDGSEIETGSATADLRLEKGTAATLSANFEGKLYRDHLLLHRGEAEVAAPAAFHVEANGIHVTASQPNSRALVSMRGDSTVQVATLTGAFTVTEAHGLRLAIVHAGQPMNFTQQPQASSTHFTGTGQVVHVNGRYYLIVSKTGVRYELVGKDLETYVAKSVTIEGTIDPNAPTTPDSAGVVTVQRKRRPGLTPIETAVIAGVVVATGIGLGVGLASGNSPVTQDSR